MVLPIISFWPNVILGRSVMLSRGRVAGLYYKPATRPLHSIFYSSTYNIFSHDQECYKYEINMVPKAAWI